MENKKLQRRETNRPMRSYKNDNSSAAATAWKVVGIAALTLTAVAVVAALPDIKRYIKISTM